jgi:acyl-coenzyme A thioesterase PaaI-like protein
MEHEHEHEHEYPDLAPEPQWTGLPDFPDQHRPRSFVSGDPDGDRLRVRYYRRRADDAFVGKVWFGPGSEGPPGFAHGGSMAAVLDEAMGGAAWLAGHVALAARLTIDFRRPLPLGSVATIETEVTREEERKVHVRGLLSIGGRSFCEGESLFVEVDPATLGMAGLKPEGPPLR